MHATQFAYTRHRRHLFGVTLALAVGTTLGAKGAEICTDLSALVAQARDNFESTTNYANPLQSLEPCKISLSLSGAKALHCPQAFSYRDTAAREAYDGMTATLETCLKRAAAPSDQQTVNHPDSYNQRVFWGEDIAITLSLKDKGALQKTYIFLSIEGAPLK